MKTQLLLAILLSSVVSSGSVQASLAGDNPVMLMSELNQLKYGPDYVTVGTINVGVTEKIILSPDTAEFSITYLTEGSTPNEASNRNAENMKKLNEFMRGLGITDKDLTTIAYRNYENVHRQRIQNLNASLHKTSFTVNVVMDQNRFLEVVALLEQNGISDLKLNEYNNQYKFKISETGSDDKATKELAQSKFKRLEKGLKDLGVERLSIEEYRNDAVEPGTEEVKKYYVQNAIKIKVTDFDHLGKIIAQAQELKMTVNNDISYSVSDEAKKRTLESHQSGLLNKLTAKGERLINTDSKLYRLGVPLTLNSNENDPSVFIRPGREMHPSALINAGQKQRFDARQVEIQPPSEYEMTLSISGTFEVVKPVYSKEAL